MGETQRSRPPPTPAGEVRVFAHLADAPPPEPSCPTWVDQAGHRRFRRADVLSVAREIAVRDTDLLRRLAR